MIDTTLPEWATRTKDSWHCSECGEECGDPNVTWCDYFGDGRKPAHAVHVRWTAEIVEKDAA